MKTHHQRTAELGELIAVVFDIAAQYSTDKQEIALLATRTVTHMLRTWQSTSPPARALPTDYEPTLWEPSAATA